MKFVTTIQELKEFVRETRQEQKAIGFVPTMGYLHEGHRALMKEARKDNDIVILSVFVNPLQFGPSEDFGHYPRDIEKDKQTAVDEGVDVLFHPTVSEMYPKNPSITMNVAKRADVLCGSSRPGHFDGVVTVLTKLFHLVEPDKVYFGQKDAQQVAVVDMLVQNFNFPLQIVPVQTVREHDGLAKSSRNVYLTEKERIEAPALYKSLQMGLEMIKAGDDNPERVTSSIIDKLQTETSGEVDYVELLTYPDLEKVDQVKGDFIIALAVKFSKARLIDNVIITEK